MRVAASNWEKEVGRTLEDAGFSVDKANSCAFWHAERHIAIVVHGDDFVISGDDHGVKYVETVLRSKYPVKVRAVLGPGSEDDHEGEILNRRIRWVW